MNQKTNYDKLRTKVFGILEGLAMGDAKYFNVRKLIIYAETVHCNQRKDGSKEFSHQLEMLALALNFHTLMLKPYEVYLAIIAHDILEDYPAEYSFLKSTFPDAVDFSNTLSKHPDTNNKESKTYYNYFEKLSSCDVCSVVKLIDRVHNLSTAPGVFSTVKLIDYCDEVDMYFIDMYRKAKANFNQREVYEILKTMLSIETRTIRSLVNLEK